MAAEIINQTDEALAYLTTATSTSVDRGKVTTPAATNVQLMARLAEKEAAINVAYKEIKELKATLGAKGDTPDRNKNYEC
jgi:hypothetical protein